MMQWNNVQSFPNDSPQVYGPRDVAELRTWLVEKWKPGTRFHKIGKELTHWIGPDSHYTGLQQASLWWIAPEMVDLLVATARSIPDDVTVPDLPSPSYSGLIILGKPWMSTDSDTGDAIPIDGLVWHGSVVDLAHNRGSVPALSIVSYRHLHWDKLDLNNPSDMRLTMAAAQLVDNPLRGMLHGHTWMPLGRSDWCVGETITSFIEGHEISEAGMQSMIDDRKLIAAFWLLMREKAVTKPTVEFVPRPTRKRAERVGVQPKVSSSVSVVTLRKLERTEHDGGSHPGKTVEWTHRWMVTGHFRWQRVGKGRSERRLTFVSPHIKGPDDKPFEPPTRVNAWRR